MKTRLQDKRFWLGSGAAAAITMVLVGWFAVIGPQRSAAKSLTDETASVRQQNSLLEARTAKLKQENTKLGLLTASLRNALAALPFDSGLPAFTRQVAAQAQGNRVDLTSIAVGSVSPVVPVGVQATPAAGTAPGSAAPATPAALAIPITLALSGLGPRLQEFVEGVQIDGPRRALVSSVQTAPASGSAKASINGSSTMTVQLTVFSAPMSPADQARLAKLLRGDVSN